MISTLSYTACSGNKRALKLELLKIRAEGKVGNTQSYLAVLLKQMPP